MARKDGRIITFYSYKGGTGRSMALSNVAWILASNGYDVLMIDWDLEAPGLHRYLRPFLTDPELANTPGLIDYVWDAAQVSITPAEKDERSAAPEFPLLLDYAVGLNWDFRGRGSISFIPAGQQDENYAQRVNTFNWDNFYERLGGGKLLQAERERLRENYHYVLIDSRTGVSDTSSICTVQMPDILAVFFTLNWQSIKGAAAVAASVTAAIKNLRNEAVPIYPVPCRIENAEAEKLDVAIRYARGVFAPFLNHVHPNFEQQSSYWKEVETPYVLFYAYEEVPAAFRDEPGSRRGVLAPNERIAYWITDHAVSAMHPQSEDDRKKVVEAYSFKNESTRSIERTPTQRGRLVDLLRWQLVRYRWRFATALAMTALFATVIVSMSQVFSLRSQLLFANAKVCEARQLVGVLQNSPSSNNQVLEAIKKILDDLSKSGSACGPAASEPAK